MHHPRAYTMIPVLLFAFVLLAAPVAHAQQRIYLPVISNSVNEASTQAAPDGTATDRQLDVAAAGAVNGYPWRNHRAPFDFTFGSNIDNHQQSKTEGKDRLTGFLYISFVDGEMHGELPVAQHQPCEEDPEACTVGWTIQGIQATARLMQHGQGQPQWCMNEEDLPPMRGYSHFHWVKETGGHTGDPVTVGDWYDGYLLKLTAVDTFWFKHAGHGSGGEMAPGGEETPGHDAGSGCGDEDSGCGDESDSCGDEGDDSCGDDHGGSGDEGGGHGKGAAVYPGIDTDSHANFIISDDCDAEELPSR